MGFPIIWLIIKYVVIFLIRLGSFFQGVRVMPKAVSIASTILTYADEMHYALNYLRYESNDVASTAPRTTAGYD